MVAGLLACGQLAWRTTGMRKIGMEDNWHAENWHGGQLACGKLTWRTIGIDFFNCFLINEKKNEKCLFSNTQEFLHNIFITSFK